MRTGPAVLPVAGGGTLPLPPLTEAWPTGTGYVLWHDGEAYALDADADGTLSAETAAACGWDPVPGADLDPAEEDVRLLLAESRGPALEVGCGHGRLLARLRAAGLAVDGIDDDPAAIVRARAVAGPEPLLAAVPLHEIVLPARYGLAYAAGDGWHRFAGRWQLARHLRNVAASVRPGGAYLVRLEPGSRPGRGAVTRRTVSYTGRPAYETRTTLAHHRLDGTSLVRVELTDAATGQLRHRREAARLELDLPALQSLVAEAGGWSPVEPTGSDHWHRLSRE